MVKILALLTFIALVFVSCTNPANPMPDEPRSGDPGVEPGDPEFVIQPIGDPVMDDPQIILDPVIELPEDEMRYGIQPIGDPDHELVVSPVPEDDSFFLGTWWVLDPESESRLEKKELETGSYTTRADTDGDGLDEIRFSNMDTWFGYQIVGQGSPLLDSFVLYDPDVDPETERYARIYVRSWN